MTMSELDFIKSKIEEFRKHAHEDFLSACNASDPYEKQQFDLQSCLNDCVSKTLENLLCELLAL